MARRQSAAIRAHHLTRKLERIGGGEEGHAPTFSTRTNPPSVERTAKTENPPPPDQAARSTASTAAP